MRQAIESIRQADDKFCTVIGTEQLFFVDRVTSDELDSLHLVFSEEDQPEISLAVLYLSQVRRDRSTERMLDRLTELRTYVDSKKSLRHKFNLVEARLNIAAEGKAALAYAKLREQSDVLSRTADPMFLGLIVNALSIAAMFVGDLRMAEECAQESCCIFRRLNHRVLYAYALNNYGIIRKKRCHFEEARRQLRQSLRVFQSIGFTTGILQAYTNLAVVAKKMGDWVTAEQLQQKIHRLVADAASNRLDLYQLKMFADINAAGLRIARRDFAEDEDLSRLLTTAYPDLTHEIRLYSVLTEFHGELEMERGQLLNARKYFERALDMSLSSAPESDVTTEILRRMADLDFREGNNAASRSKALKCIRMCKQIGDQYELGAALRVLGQAYAADGVEKKAIPAFEMSIHILKSIHAAYELMRSCLHYGAFLVDKGSAEAEVHLLEARQLCRKLELSFFACRVSIELARHHTKVENHDEARVHLVEAEKLFEGLQECDRAQIEPHLTAARNTLDTEVIRVGMESAEELTTMCRIYEEARFPLAKTTADLSYQIAQSIEADRLFLVRRTGSGYEIPILYNISKKDAREVVRRLDREHSRRKRPLLGLKDKPRTFDTYTDERLTCVPDRNYPGWVLCVLQTRAAPQLSSRRLEILYTSIEPLSRLAEERESSAESPASGFLEGRRALSHPRGSFSDILTVDPEMIKRIHLAERASQSDVTILLEGETGVGKELFARAIHNASARSDSPFVAINAGGMPVALLESELFGHVKGAFTDAATDREGLVTVANGGTLFLDEVGEMGEELQIKLLRLLENGEYRRLGDNEVRTANVRVVSATNRDLGREVERGRFRRDLFYRLRTVRLTIPPLRFRQNDIQLLIRHFVKECGLRAGQAGRHFQFDVKAVEALQAYPWPGNVRELYNEIFRIVSLIGGNDVIRFGMLSEEIQEHVSAARRSEGILEQTVEQFERRLILEALDMHDWNRLRAAEHMGIPRTTLVTKMKRLNIVAR